MAVVLEVLEEEVQAVDLEDSAAVAALVVVVLVEAGSPICSVQSQ